MKKIRCFLMLLLFVLSVSAHGQTREIYINGNFRTLAKGHQIVAILPFKTIIKLRPKQMEKMTPEHFTHALVIFWVISVFFVASLLLDKLTF